MRTTPGLVDAEQMAKQHPGTFELPFRHFRYGLQRGDVAKVCKDQRVRFFVCVHERRGDAHPVYIGRAMRAAEEADVEAGAEIVFEPRHVYEVGTPQLMQLFDIAIDPLAAPNFRPAIRWTGMASECGYPERLNVLASLAGAMAFGLPATFDHSASLPLEDYNLAAKMLEDAAALARRLAAGETEFPEQE